MVYQKVIRIEFFIIFFLSVIILVNKRNFPKNDWNGKPTNGSFDFTNCTIFIVSSSSSKDAISGRWGKKSFWATASWAHIKLWKLTKQKRFMTFVRNQLDKFTWKCGVCNKWKSSRHSGEMWQRGARSSRISKATCPC